MKFFYFLTINIITCVLLSCENPDKNNASEHMYVDMSNNKLILNTSYTNVDVDIVQSFHDKLSRVSKSQYSIEQINAFLDSMNFKTNTVNIIADTTYITKAFIKRNTELSFKAWKQSSWYDSCDYQIFCDYVLPYKLNREIVDNWRDTLYRFHLNLIKNNPELKNIDSLYQYHMSKTYYSLGSFNYFKDYKVIEPNFSWISLINEGDCWERSRLVMYYLRAAGAPATLDFIPEWGNRKAATHAFVGLANKHKQVNKLLCNNNDPTNLVNDFNAAIDAKYKNVFEQVDIPEVFDIQYEKTIPKVYRKTWNTSKEENKSLMYDNENLKYNNCEDVTDQYLETSEITINDNVFSFEKECHLSVFSKFGWKPIATTKFNLKGEAKFNKLGKNVVYLPNIINDNYVIPKGKPFILTDTGKIDLECDYTKKIDINLLRKYPIFTNTALYLINFKGCKIEGSNDYYFNNTTLLHQINYYPFFVQLIDVSPIDSFQYIHIISPDELIRVAEFECFEDSCGVLRKIVEIEYKNSANAKYFADAIDGDYNTSVTSKWVRIEFDKPRHVKQIRFCPRSDSNFIIPGNIYELFYWDDKWISLGKQKASEFKLKYSNVPSGSLYWLKCLSEGNEERIFTYEKGKQIWW